MPPKVAYVLLWFPKPSETFIFHEVVQLRRSGLPLKVYTLYGDRKRDLAPSMTADSGDVQRLGMPYLGRLPLELFTWWKRAPRKTGRLFATIPFRRWSDPECAGENLWAFLCGFRLARLAERDGIEHIHAPWANGPATAAWVASQLTGIPFSFAAHAGDIYPPDGALAEKIRDCTFVRTENRANVPHLENHCAGAADKIHVVYNGIPVRQGFAPADPATEAGSVPPRPSAGEVRGTPPLRILALGRFVPKKGFDVLIRSCKILNDAGMDFQLTMGGSGPHGRELLRLTATLGLESRIAFPGFVLHSRVPDFLRSGDVFVMPSVVDGSGDRDGIPTVILEALLHRVPVVASDVGGIGEIIKDGVTGLLIPPGDPNALARAVMNLAADRQTAGEMAERGRSAVLEAFDVERNCRVILDLLVKYSRFRETPATASSL